MSEEANEKGRAPRITPAHITNSIASKHYFNAADGQLGAYKNNDDVYQGDRPNDLSIEALPLLTFCVLVLKNGFTVTGKSACASPENFDKQIGEEIAYKNAINEIWVLEGYLLKQRLHEKSHS